MKAVFYFALYWIFRIGVSLRYRVQIKGLEEIRKEKKKGILFLPNHPAEIDPLLLMLVLWRDFQPKPMAIEHFYYQKGLRFFMDLVGALPLPTMDVANQWKRKKIEKLKKVILERLRQGESFIIYPSGKLKTTPDEQIGGASFIHDLLTISPDLSIVLIRTTGLWGSIFSKALTEGTPDFWKMLIKGFKIGIKNGIFFTPRRKILIELEKAPENFPRKASRIDLNKYLEDWYNRYPNSGPEPVKLVSYYFWKKELPEVVISETPSTEQKVEVPKEVEEAALEHLSKISRYPKEQIHRGMHLSNDLGLDSLDIAQLHIFLEERFSIEEMAPGQMQTVSDFLRAAVGKARKKEEGEQPVEKVKLSEWPKETNRPSPHLPEGKTLQEVFLRICDRMNSHIAAADRITKPLSYQKLKKLALILSFEMQNLPGEKIGILLPSSVGTYLLILALLLAKKVPVMLNWTSGPKAIDHSVKVTDLKVILSSFRFLGRIENGDLGSVDDLLLLLEDLRMKISLKNKLKGLIYQFYSWKSLLKKLNLDKLDEKSWAVVIFTSGTETLPKGVPLSHKNILSNFASAFSCMQFTSEDLLYGVLPPFHSFGFSATGIGPLVTGIKICFAPDPTDSRALGDDIAHFKPTVFCCAPSFIKNLFRVVKREQLESISLYISGAEKAPDELFNFVKSLGKEKKMIEGYGVSECSPIVTMDRWDRPHKGVGYTIPGVELCIINPETNEVLGKKQEGEICIHGPNVFEGYLGYDRSPFIILNGKKWYRSGDRGYLEEDGALFITGRLKRFVKIGGEMVSLGGIEEEMEKLCKEKNWPLQKGEGPSFAVAAKGKESDKPEIILFTTFDVNKEEINQFFKDKGWSRLVKISEVKKIEQIPLTGTGKTHYRALEEMISS